MAWVSILHLYNTSSASCAHHPTSSLFPPPFISPFVLFHLSHPLSLWQSVQMQFMYWVTYTNRKTGQLGLEHREEQRRFYMRAKIKTELRDHLGEDWISTANQCLWLPWKQHWIVGARDPQAVPLLCFWKSGTSFDADPIDMPFSK